MNRKILIIGIGVHLLASFFSIGFNNHDEHFQILEFAALKLNLTDVDDMPWEYDHQMRSAVQPGIAYLGISASNLIGLDSPFSQATVLRIISSLLALLCMALLIKSFEGEVKSPFLKEWFIFLSLLLWFMPYIHARFSSENWSGLAFWVGLALLNFPRADATNKNGSHIRELLIGILLGFSIALKFQAGLMVVGLILWLIIVRKEKYSSLAMLILGALIPVFIELLVDRWFYGDWAIAAWNYFKVNIIEGKVSQFGINPWWYYFKEIFFKAIPPFSIFIVINTIVFWICFPRHVVTWVTVPFILVHSIIGHKDIRFLFPLVNILPFVLVVSFQVFEEDPRFRRVKKVFEVSKRYIVWTFVPFNSILLLIVCLRPADPATPLYQYIYNHYDAKNTVLAYDKENPFHRGGADIHFYKKKDLSLIRTESPEELQELISNSNKKVLLATQELEFDAKMDVNCTKVYQYLPPIVKYFNFNNWLKRTKHWMLYECTSE